MFESEKSCYYIREWVVKESVTLYLDVFFCMQWGDDRSLYLVKTVSAIELWQLLIGKKIGKTFD